MSFPPAGVFTSHNEVKQLAGVRFILGVGKNPFYFCDRGPDTVTARSYSLMFFYTESEYLLQGCETVHIFTAALADGSTFISVYV